MPLGARIPLPKDVFRFGLALSHCALISVTQRLADEAPRWQDVTVRGAVDLGAAAYAATLAQALDTLARRAPSDGVSLLNRASELAPHALERTRTLVLMANAARCLAQGNIGNRQALAVYQRVYGELLPAIEREQENASTRVSPLSRTVLERWLYETLMTVYATDQEDFAIFSDRAHVLRAWYEHQRTGLRFLSRAEIIRDAGLPPTATDDDLARAIAREIRAGDNVFEQYAAELAATSDAAFIEEVEASRANPARLRSLLEALVVRSAIDLTPDSTRVEVPRLLAQIDRNIARLGHLAAAMASFEADERPHATVIVEAAQQFLTFYRRLYAGAIGGTPPTAQDVVRTFEAIGGAHFPCTMSFVRTLDFDNLSLIPLTPPADCLDARQASWWDPSFVDGHVRLVAALAIKFLVKTDARGASLNGTDLAEIGPREFQFLEDRARRLFVPSLLAINRFFEPAGDPQERQWLASVLGTDSYDQAVDARGWNAETRLTLQLTLPQ